MKTSFIDDIIIETKNFKVAQDWDIAIPGFFILSTLRKVDSFAEFTDEEAQEFGVLVKKIRKGMLDVLGYEHVYLFQNEDSEHGFHLWMLPRHEWMEEFGRKVQSVRPILEHAGKTEPSDELVKEVREQVAKMKQYIGV